MSAPRFPVAEGSAHVEQDMLTNGRVPYDLAPEGFWHTEISHTTFTGGAQVLTITIPAAGFVAGRLDLTFSGGVLPSPIVISSIAATGDANTDLAATLEADLATARAGSLAAVIDDESVASNVVTLALVEGSGVTVTRAFTPAQAFSAIWDPQDIGSAIVDGAYTVTLSGGALAAPDSTTVNAVGVANAAALAVLFEAALEAKIATTLAGVLVSADDDGVNLNTLIFEPIADPADPPYAVAITAGRGELRLVFGGTATNGDYVATFDHDSLPSPVAIVVVRAAGTPATNTDLADQMETQIEANAQLAPLVALADNSGAGNSVLTFAGIVGLTATTAAPAPGTLTANPNDSEILESTPAGPTITLSSRFTVAITDVDSGNAIPPRMAHFGGYIDVKTSFGSGTLYVDRGTGTIATDYIATANATSATVQGGGSASEEPYGILPTNALRVHLVGATSPPTAGRAHVAITLAPLPEDLTS